MCRMNDSLELYERPRTIISETISVCTQSNVSSGFKCNFLDWQKCMCLVLVLENLKPFSLDYLLKLFSACCTAAQHAKNIAPRAISQFALDFARTYRGGFRPQVSADHYYDWFLPIPNLQL